MVIIQFPKITSHNKSFIVPFSCNILNKRHSLTVNEWRNDKETTNKDFHENSDKIKIPLELAKPSHQLLWTQTLLKCQSYVACAQSHSHLFSTPVNQQIIFSEVTFIWQYSTPYISKRLTSDTTVIRSRGFCLEFSTREDRWGVDKALV